MLLYPGDGAFIGRYHRCEHAAFHQLGVFQDQRIFQQTFGLFGRTFDKQLSIPLEETSAHQGADLLEGNQADLGVVHGELCRRGFQDGPLLAVHQEVGVVELHLDVDLKPHDPDQARLRFVAGQGAVHFRGKIERHEPVPGIGTVNQVRVHVDYLGGGNRAVAAGDNQHR